MRDEIEIVASYLRDNGFSVVVESNRVGIMDDGASWIAVYPVDQQLCKSVPDLASPNFVVELKEYLKECMRHQTCHGCPFRMRK